MQSSSQIVTTNKPTPRLIPTPSLFTGQIYAHEHTDFGNFYFFFFKFCAYTTVASSCYYGIFSFTEHFPHVDCRLIDLRTSWVWWPRGKASVTATLSCLSTTARYIRTTVRSHLASPLPTSLVCLDIFYCQYGTLVGYWHQRADERHGNPPPR